MSQNKNHFLKKKKTIITPSQWRSQEFRLGGARLKDKIENKKLI